MVLAHDAESSALAEMSLRYIDASTDVLFRQCRRGLDYRMFEFEQKFVLFRQCSAGLVLDYRIFDFEYKLSPGVITNVMYPGV